MNNIGVHVSSLNFHLKCSEIHWNTGDQEMADAALSFAIERLGDLLISEAKSLYGVEGQVAILDWM